MRVSEANLRSFASSACRNIFELDFDNAKKGQVLAQTMVSLEEQGIPVIKEVAFVVGEGVIKVRAKILCSEEVSTVKEQPVFEMISGEPPDVRYEGNFNQPRSETLFMIDTEERAFEILLKVLGLDELT